MSGANSTRNWIHGGCPRCHGDIHPSGETYRCLQCGRALNPFAFEPEQLMARNLGSPRVRARTGRSSGSGYVSDNG